MKIKKGSFKIFFPLIAWSLFFIVAVAAANSEQIANIVFTIFLGIIAVGGILFFSLIFIQIPLSCFTNYYLYNGLSNEDYELSQSRQHRNSWLMFEKDNFSEERLEENKKNIERVLKPHKLCYRYYKDFISE